MFPGGLERDQWHDMGQESNGELVNCVDLNCTEK